MAAKLTRLTHKIAIQLHLVAESCTSCSSRSRWPVRKLLDTPSYSVSCSGCPWLGDEFLGSVRVWGEGTVGLCLEVGRCMDVDILRIDFLTK
jgi:hypothetical protein